MSVYVIRSFNGIAVGKAKNKTKQKRKINDEPASESMMTNVLLRRVSDSVKQIK